MEVLKHGIGLRGYAQMNPKDEFKKEGFQKFEMLKHAIADQVTDLIFKVELSAPPELRQHHAPMAPPPMPSDPATQQAIMEAMIAAGQAPPEIMEALARGETIRVHNEAEAAMQAQEAAAQQAAVKAARGGKKPKRNDPCPCGSGIKYKKCCHPAFD